MTVRWWWLVVVSALSVAVGVLATLLVDVVRDDFGFYPRTDPGAARWTCDGADVVAAAALDEGIVTVHVTVRDELAREWRVRFGDGSAEVLRSAVDGTYPTLTAATGDLDDGYKRRVRTKPAGTDAWCEGEVSLT